MKPQGAGQQQWHVRGLLLALIVVVSGCGGYTSSDTASSDDTSNTGGTNTSNLSQSPQELGVGDLMFIDAASGTTNVSFVGVADGSKFYLAVGSANTLGTSSSIQLGTASVSASIADIPFKGMGTDEVEEALLDENEVWGPNEMMSAWLRASEEGLHQTETPAMASGSSTAKGMTIKAESVGDTRTFRVLSSLSSVNSYVEVTAKVKCVGSNVVFYVDTTVSQEKIADSEVTELCTTFDSEASREMDILGTTSDVDENDKTIVVMTKQINQLGALGGGVITGYFYAGDVYARSENNLVSNYGEIIYTMVPDESGEFGIAIQKSFALNNLLPAVFPHELQHAISYNQHVFVSGSAPEETWLNEGLSHLMEDVMGHNVENPSRYALYLSSPSTYGVVTQSSPNLMERGASYLFLRYLYEQASNGNSFLKALEGSARGISNVEAAFNGPSGFETFEDFMKYWTAALLMTDRGISTDSRFTYRARVQDSVTGNWQGVCLSCNADDGRGTTMTGVNLNTYNGTHTVTVDGSTAKFFNMTTVPNVMTLGGAADGASYGVLVRYE